MPDIALKRAYDEPADRDGYRILVDRIWPRGVSKEEARIDEWAKEIAPSTELRKWFGHDPGRWKEFRRRYMAELNALPEDGQEWLRGLAGRVAKQRVTLVYAARDQEHNQAVVLKEFLEKSDSD